MAKYSVFAGQTSNIWLIKAFSSTATDGSGLTGLTPATSALTCYYIRSDMASSTVVALSTITTLGTFASGGFREIDSTNMKGWYEFHPPNAAFTSGRTVGFQMQSSSTALGQIDMECEIFQINTQSSSWPLFDASASTIVKGIVGSGPSSTSIPTNLTSGGTGFFNGRTLIFTSGALQNQATSVTGTTSGASCTLTVSALTSAPAQNDTFVLV